MSPICHVCPQACRLEPGEVGRCRARIARDEQVISQNYGQITSLSLDPVEKKPLYHWHPGKLLLSVGSQGCNLNCAWCQNHQIAQQPAAYRQFTAEELASFTVQVQEEHPNCAGIAFTYNEPVIGFEWVRDVSRLVREAGLTSALVSNGFMNPGPWRELLSSLDVMNVDVKSFSEKFYREQCGGSLAPVLRNVEAAVDQVEVELTYLVIPGLNDDPAEFERFVAWVAALSTDLPVHLSRYFPSHKLHLPPTPLSTLRRLQQLARERLNFVYLGNVGQPEDTRCPQCGLLWVHRAHGQVSVSGVRRGSCQGCGRVAPLAGLE